MDRNLKDILKGIGLFIVLLALAGFSTLFIIRAIKTHANTSWLTNTPLVKVDAPMDYTWTLKTMDGKTVNVSDLRGKVLFINNWASWCPACLSEMDSIERLWEHFEKQNPMAFLIVSEEDMPPVQAFLQKHRYRFPVYI